MNIETMREQFEKDRHVGPRSGEGYCLASDQEAWDNWLSGYDAGVKAGAQEERGYMQSAIEVRARRLMLEYYDADVYKRALEEHLNVCTRPIVIPASVLRKEM